MPHNRPSPNRSVRFGGQRHKDLESTERDITRSGQGCEGQYGEEGPVGLDLAPRPLFVFRAYDRIDLNASPYGSRNPERVVNFRQPQSSGFGGPMDLGNPTLLSAGPYVPPRPRQAANGVFEQPLLSSPMNLEDSTPTIVTWKSPNDRSISNISCSSISGSNGTSTTDWETLDKDQNVSSAGDVAWSSVDSVGQTLLSYENSVDCSSQPSQGGEAEELDCLLDTNELEFDPRLYHLDDTARPNAEYLAGIASQALPHNYGSLRPDDFDQGDMDQPDPSHRFYSESQSRLASRPHLIHAGRPIENGPYDHHTDEYLTCPRTPKRPRRDSSSVQRGSRRRTTLSQHFQPIAPRPTESQPQGLTRAQAPQSESSWQPHVRVLNSDMEEINPPTTRRQLPPEDRRHAARVRVVGACERCKSRKSRCTHVLPEDQPSSSAPSPGLPSTPSIDPAHWFSQSPRVVDD